MASTPQTEAADRKTPPRGEPGSPGARPATTPDSHARARRSLPRLPRGPLVIGAPAAHVQPQLAADDPYRPDTMLDGGSAFGLTVRAASVRGLAKRWAGTPRQDDICLRRHDATGTLILALADGVSGAPRSHVGAALAVRHAAAAIARQLDRRVADGGQAPDESGRTPACGAPGAAGIDWHEVFHHAAWALLEAHRVATGDPDADVEGAAAALSSTMLVAVVGGAAGQAPEAGARVELACVGDSPALMLAGGRFRPLLGDIEDPDELLGAGVRALPRATDAVRSASCTLACDQVLLLCTDGFSLPLGNGSNDVGAVFARELRRPPDILDFAKLLDFSRSTYDDDRSLIAVWPPQS